MEAIRTPRQVLEIKCEYCGITFEAHRVTRRYCSDRCKTLGRARERQPRICAREECDRTFFPLDKGHRFCSFECARYGVARETAQQRGDTLRGRGEGKTYIKIGGRHAHRVIAEEALGRQLRPGEIVHHRDEDKRNNDPSNLVVLANQAEHIRIHVPRRKKGKN